MNQDNLYKGEIRIKVEVVKDSEKVKLDLQNEELLEQSHEVIEKEENAKFKNVLIRMPINVIDKMDEELKARPWMTRTGLIMEAVHLYTKRDRGEQ